MEDISTPQTGKIINNMALQLWKDAAPHRGSSKQNPFVSEMDRITY